MGELRLLPDLVVAAARARLRWFVGAVEIRGWEEAVVEALQRLPQEPAKDLGVAMVRAEAVVALLLAAWDRVAARREAALSSLFQTTSEASPGSAKERILRFPGFLAAVQELDDRVTLEGAMVLFREALRQEVQLGWRTKTIASTVPVKFYFHAAARVTSWESPLVDEEPPEAVEAAASELVFAASGTEDGDGPGVSRRVQPGRRRSSLSDRAAEGRRKLQYVSLMPRPVPRGGRKVGGR